MPGKGGQPRCGPAVVGSLPSGSGPDPHVAPEISARQRRNCRAGQGERQQQQQQQQQPGRRTASPEHVTGAFEKPAPSRGSRRADDASSTSAVAGLTSTRGERAGGGAGGCRPAGDHDDIDHDHDGTTMRRAWHRRTALRAPRDAFHRGSRRATTQAVAPKRRTTPADTLTPRTLPAAKRHCEYALQSQCSTDKRGLQLGGPMSPAPLSPSRVVSWPLGRWVTGLRRFLHGTKPSPAAAATLFGGCSGSQSVPARPYRATGGLDFFRLPKKVQNGCPALHHRPSLARIWLPISGIWLMGAPTTRQMYRYLRRTPLII